MSVSRNNCYSVATMNEPENILRGPPMHPLPNISVGQYLLNSLRANGDTIFQIDMKSGKRITNRVILEMSVNLARVLEKRGVGPADRVAISAENHLYWLVAACATLFVGAVLAPLNPAYTEWELKNVLNISKPKVIFVSRLSERLLSKLAADSSWSMEIIQLDERAHDKRVPTLTKILAADRSPDDIHSYKPAEVGNLRRRTAVILCSSGTTGLPKGVALSHHNIMFFICNAPGPDALDFRRGDRPLIFLPFFHGYAFGLMLMVISRGMTGVVMSSFQIDAFLAAVQSYRVTHISIVPPVLVLLAKHPLAGSYDFSSVREFLCAAAPLPKDVTQEVMDRLKVPVIRNAYGMTELSILVCASDRSGDDGRTVGRLLPGILCKVVDQPTHETLPAGRVGELCFKGDLVMLGYYDNTEATALTIDEDGWLYSGDLGYYDNEGRIFVSGRLKELIKYKGFQVSPSELETILLSHPAVKDAAVVGKADEISGELPMAFIVKQPGGTATAAEIVKFTNEKVSPQKWLRGGAQFINEIPKNASGKILRRELTKFTTKL